MIKIFLLDLDGVLCNAVILHQTAFLQAIKELTTIEISEEEHNTSFNGLPTKKKLKMLIEQGRIKNEDLMKISDRKQELTKELIPQLLHFDHEKVDLLKDLKELGTKVVCVTNSIRETAELMLKRTGQLKYLDWLVSNEDVRYPKPHGEGYIKCLVKFQVMPEECLIIEDSPHGIAAAKSTGAHVLEVAGPHEVNWDNIMKKLGEING